MPQTLDLSDLPPARPAPTGRTAPLSLDLSDLPPARPQTPAPLVGRERRDDTNPIIDALSLDRVIPTGLRVLPAIAGSVLGSALGPGGTVGGGVLGSAGGELMAEGYEKMRGLREEINPTQIAVQGALGAIPVVGRAGSVAGTVLSRAGQGALMGATADVATRWAEGDDQSLPSALASAGVGAALGAVGGRFEAKRAQRIAARPPLDLSDLPPAATADPPSVPAAAVADVVPPAVTEALTPAPTGRAPLAEIHAPTVGSRSSSELKAERMASVAGVSIPEAGTIPPREIVQQKAAQFLGDNPEAASEFNDILARNEGFVAQRRGIQSDDRADILAQFVNIDPSKLPARGTTFNNEEIRALGNAYVNARERLLDLNLKAAEGTASPQDLLTRAQAMADLQVLAATRMGVRAEAGRALRQLGRVNELMQTFDDRIYDTIAKDPTLRNNPKFNAEFAQAKTPQEQFEVMRRHKSIGTLDTVQGYVYANMLSGVRTTLRNVLGALNNGLFRQGSTLLATGYDAAEAAVTGRPRTMYLSEIPERAKGAVFGLSRGLDEAVFTLKHGYGREALETFDVPRPELPGGSKNPLNYVGRALEAQDQLSFAVAKQMELNARTHARARSMGLSGEALDAKMAEWALSPPKDIAEAAQQEALRTLNREDPGEFVNRIMDLKSSGSSTAERALSRVLGLIVPFIRIPANIMRQSLENTPVGLLMPEIQNALKAGGRARAEAIGRVTAGSAGLAALTYWAAQGKISGDGPADPAERAALLRTGWQPNSIKVGDRWVQYQSLTQPLAIPVAAVANYYERSLRDPETPPTGAQLFFETGKSVLDASFLTGVYDLVKAFSEEGYGDVFMQRWASNFVPFGALQRNVAQAIDPVVRQPKGATTASNVLEGVKAGLPGLSTTVAPRLNAYGEAVRRQGGPFNRGLTPVVVNQERRDPVDQALRAVGYVLQEPEKTLDADGRQGGETVTLTIPERQQIGRATRQALERLVLMPGWSPENPEFAQERIRRVVSDARARAYATIRQARRAQR